MSNFPFGPENDPYLPPRKVDGTQKPTVATLLEKFVSHQVNRETPYEAHKRKQRKPTDQIR